MHIYFSGIGGVGIGPLARIARDLGYSVTGSDAEESRNTKALDLEGIDVQIGQSEATISRIHNDDPIDWFVYTSGLPADHPELLFAKQNGIKTAKRDEMINLFLEQNHLKMLAIAGTHGKTNTTGLMVWVLKSLGMPISYSIGSNISFGPNGKYQENSQYFVYEADEFDRNFLHFDAEISLFTSVDYDHPDTYPTVQDYKNAFKDFAKQSQKVITWRHISDYLELDSDEKFQIINDNYSTSALSLLGEHTRKNAVLVFMAVQKILPSATHAEIIDAINSYPGTERRMEKLASNLFTDYAHHPIEIVATLKAAKETGKAIVAVYQPHQNVRQHEVRELYTDTFELADKIYWLPTYLSREDPSLEILNPEDLTSKLTNKNDVSFANMDQNLAEAIKKHLSDGAAVILMSAGSLDAWARINLIES
jgi:UDP-N-acetylmuramate--alanine ligase